MYTKVKRTIDIILSFSGLVMLSPILLLIIIFIKLDSKGPAIFKQKRYGKDSEFFYIYKFRTMTIDAPKDTPTHLLERDYTWTTPVGKFLRRTDLDELPQLLNILKGDMSFVGPRPALWNQYDLMEKRERYGVNALQVGLTGWAQVNGRDGVSLEEKVELDREYAEKFGFLMDAKCILKTFSAVINQGNKGWKNEEYIDNR